MTLATIWSDFVNILWIRAVQKRSGALESIHLKEEPVARSDHDLPPIIFFLLKPKTVETKETKEGEKMMLDLVPVKEKQTWIQMGPSIGK